MRSVRPPPVTAPTRELVRPAAFDGLVIPLADVWDDADEDGDEPTE